MVVFSSWPTRLRFTSATYSFRSASRSAVSSGVSFAVIRAMSARLYRDTGVLSDHAFVALCRHYARSVEENSQVRSILNQRFPSDPLYSQDNLQRMLWQ